MIYDLRTTSRDAKKKDTTIFRIFTFVGSGTWTIQELPSGNYTKLGDIKSKYINMQK